MLRYVFESSTDLHCLRQLLFQAIRTGDDVLYDLDYMRDLYDRIDNTIPIPAPDVDDCWDVHISAGVTPRWAVERTEPPAPAQQEIFDQRAGN